MTLSGAAVALLAAAPSAAQDRLTLVYDLDPVVRQLAHPQQGPGLSPARGAFRQEPGTGGMFTGQHPSSSLVAKASGAQIAGMSAPDIAALLTSRIRAGEYGAATHMVAIDELGAPFADTRPRRVTRGARLPAVRADWPGARFTTAMRLLDTPSPYGGTWASRVHVYLAPTVHASIAAGRGPERNLGRDRKPHLRSWRAMMPGLALAGGVHLQMYHARGGVRSAFTAGEWRGVPGSFTRLFQRYGGQPSRVHFVFSQVESPPGAPGGCGHPTTCAWRLAESTPVGRQVLANGPGVYRIGDDAAIWLDEFNRRFP